MVVHNKFERIRKKCFRFFSIKPLLAKEMIQLITVNFILYTQKYIFH